MRNDYDLVVFGATMLGIGAACACKGKCLIIERSLRVGYEFINSFVAGNEYSPKSERGGELVEEIEKLNLKCGSFRLPELAPVLYRMLEKKEIPVLFMTEIIDVKKRGFDFEIEIYNTSGLSVIRSEQILDTNVKSEGIIKKYFNALLYNENTELPLLNLPGVKTVPFSHFGELLLKIELDLDDDFISARHKLHSAYESNSAKLKNWLIAAAADYFEVKTAPGISEFKDGQAYMPSCAYSGYIEAFDMGAGLF